MNNYPSNYADEIKARVPLLDLLHFYGFHPQYNRMPCPFHNGKDRNMLVSNNFYKCFVCGESGDIFTFVQRYFGLDFNAACAKINDDFSLGLPIGKKLTRAEENEARLREDDRQARERKRKSDERRERLDGIEKAYNKALDEFTTCDIMMAKCAPVSQKTGLTAAFCWAAQNIDRAWAELKEAEAALFRFRQEENG